eukprot:gb/GEZN01010477.1/.p1 GENE.gb/GEZN01010477.1/~~gb/GEZN01010477.1/.p1  ORF type:complete len:348 (-),score=33.01 gb/GEZN01010477.1/:81-1124(-)
MPLLLLLEAMAVAITAVAPVMVIPLPATALVLVMVIPLAAMAAVLVTVPLGTAMAAVLVMVISIAVRVMVMPIPTTELDMGTAGVGMGLQWETTATTMGQVGDTSEEATITVRLGMATQVMVTPEATAGTGVAMRAVAGTVGVMVSEEVWATVAPGMRREAQGIAMVEEQGTGEQQDMEGCYPLLPTQPTQLAELPAPAAAATAAGGASTTGGTTAAILMYDQYQPAALAPISNTARIIFPTGGTSGQSASSANSVSAAALIQPVLTTCVAGGPTIGSCDCYGTTCKAGEVCLAVTSSTGRRRLSLLWSKAVEALSSSSSSLSTTSRRDLTQAATQARTGKCLALQG